jgi:fatty-acyl-CoA synthase
VPINAMLMPDEVRHIIEDSGARVIIAASELLPRVAALDSIAHAVVVSYQDYLRTPTDLPVPDLIAKSAQDALPSMVFKASPWKDACAGAPRAQPSVAGPDDLCVMPYTSGTTGAPKGCIHTHRTVMSTTAAQSMWYGGLAADSVMFCTLPLFHVTAMQASMNTPLYAGLTIVILPRWDREVAVRMVERYRISHWTCITTMLVDFLANPKLAAHDLSSFKRIGGGGAAMPEAVAQKLEDLMALKYIEGYGLSETIAPSHINPPDRPKKQCLGVPIFDVDARIVDPDTLKEVPQGESGEIITRGPQVFKGYWNDEAKTRAAFIEHDGHMFFRTGDLARMDEDGYFFMVDRLKRMINASGFKVWPAEIEASLYAHPAVREACVVASPDAHRGETVKAFIVRNSGRDDSAEDIMAWSREKMAAYKVPRLIEFVDALPKSGTGKVQWRMLQEAEYAK